MSEAHQGLGGRESARGWSGESIHAGARLGWWENPVGVAVEEGVESGGTDPFRARSLQMAG